MTSTSRDDDEWTIIPPGASPPAVSGPSAGDWTIIPADASRAARSPPVSAQDAVNIGAQGGNAFLFGLGNRIIAGSRALEGKESYGDALKRLDAEDRAVRERHPWLSAGAEVVGGVGNAAALTGKGVLRGAQGRFPAPAGWLAQGGRGLAEGGVLGALQGAGTTYSGIPSDYVHNAGMGGILGAGMGAVAPAIGSAAGAAYRAVADRGWRGGIPAHVAGAAQADEAGLRALPNTPGAMLPDAGPSMLGVTQGAVTEGPGSSRLITNLTERNRQSAPRITADIDQTFGPAPVPSHVDAQIQTQVDAMSPRYTQALNNARAVDTNPAALWLEGMIGRTAGPEQAALTAARRALDIPTNPGVLDPHPERLQAVRSSVRGQAEEAERTGNTRLAGVLRQTERRLTEELWDKVPGIRQLDAERAELGSQQRAIDAAGQGRRMFETAEPGVVRPVELQETLTAAAQPKGINVGPSAEAFRLTQAGRAEVDRIIGTNKNDLLKLENVLGQPQDWNAQKLAVMFGQDRADALMEVLRRERMFRETHQKVVEGSQTARRTQAQKALEGDEGKIPWDLGVTGAVARGTQELIRSARRSSINAGRDRLAGLLAEQDPARIQDLVAQMLAAQPTRDMRQELVKRLTERGIIGGAPALAPSITNR